LGCEGDKRQLGSVSRRRGPATPGRQTIGHQVGTVADAVRAAARNGEIICFGIPDDMVSPFAMMAFLRKNATLIAGLTWEKRAALAKASDYLTAHPDPVHDYVTDRFGFSEAQTASDIAVRPSKGRLKIVLDLELDEQRS